MHYDEAWTAGRLLKHLGRKDEDAESSHTQAEALLAFLYIPNWILYHIDILIWWYGPNYCLFSFLNRFWVFSFLYLCWFYMLLPDSAFEVSMLWHVCLGNCFCRLASRSWQAGGLPCVNKEYRAILTFDIWWFCATYLFVWMWVLTQHAMLVFDSFLLANPISGHEPAFLL